MLYKLVVEFLSQTQYRTSLLSYHIPALFTFRGWHMWIYSRRKSMSPFLWLSFVMSVLVPKKSHDLPDVLRKQMVLLVLRCHLKDLSQSILCCPIYLPSKGEGLSWSFWDWNLWLQRNLSILTLRALRLSQSSSTWQFIFVEFITLILVLFPCEMCHHFCLLLKCTAHEAKYIGFSVAVKLQQVWNLCNWNGIFKELNLSALIAFTWASLCSYSNSVSN